MFFKVAFQNVRTINTEKLVRLNSFLDNVDIIFLSEVDKSNFRFIADGNFQFHYDPSPCRRIAMLASNLIDIQPIGPGLILSQERQRKDQTALQTYLYKVTIKVKNEIHIFHIENIYSIPCLSPINRERLVEFLSDRPIQYSNYMCGGDFNLNWLTSDVRNSFESIGGLTQQIHTFTRSCTYSKKVNGIDQQHTSNSIIDLIFTSTSVTKKCRRAYTRIIQCRPGDKSASFDHKAVVCEFELRLKHYYRDIVYYSNPHNRPQPNEVQLSNLKRRIDDIDVKDVHSVDNLMHRVRLITNEILPNNPSGPRKKRLYRNPLSKEIIKEIDLKHKLLFKAIHSKDDYEKYRIQKNKVTALVRQSKNDYHNNLFRNTNSASHIQRTIDALEKDEITNISGNPDKLEFEIDDILCSGQVLADKASQFYFDRAVNLVPNDEVIAAGDPGPILKPDESLPIFNFPVPSFEHPLNKYIPKSKQTGSSGPDNFSAALLALVWPMFQDKFNKVLQKNSLSYPSVDQGYFQKTIPKVPNPKKLKDLRPIGVLNPVTKYLLNGPFFKALREHLAPIFKRRRNYSYLGTHLCIIQTLDHIITKIHLKIPTLLVKYDFSNAFGTTHPERVMEAFSQLNLTDGPLDFLEGYVYNQRFAQTILSDKTGYYTTGKVEMTRGNPQGQIGADLVFLVQQLALREIEGVLRTIYVDDINDTVNAETEVQAVSTAIRNEIALKEQVVQVGFKLNADKTRYIPFNIDNNILVNNGLDPLNIEKSSCLLGFPFEALTNGIDITPATEMILKRLRKKCITVHAARNYVSDKEVLVKIARTLIYHCIGEIHLIYAYDKNGKNFNRIRVQVNNILRATGLRSTTPTNVLDKVFGTSLKDFAEQGVIINGLKIAQDDPSIFDKRLKDIRHFFPPNTYINKFKELWNDFRSSQRSKILKMDYKFDNIKNFLKGKRTLKYDKSIHVDYKWIDFRSSF